MQEQGVPVRPIPSSLPTPKSIDTKVLSGPMVWKGSHFKNREESYIVRLTEEDVAEINSALALYSGTSEIIIIDRLRGPVRTEAFNLRETFC